MKYSDQFILSLKDMNNFLDRPDHVEGESLPSGIVCPACGKLTLRRWGLHLICSTCGAQQVATKDGYHTYGFPDPE